MEMEDGLNNVDRRAASDIKPVQKTVHIIAEEAARLGSQILDTIYFLYRKLESSGR